MISAIHSCYLDFPTDRPFFIVFGDIFIGFVPTARWQTTEGALVAHKDKQLNQVVMSPEDGEYCVPRFVFV